MISICNIFHNQILITFICFNYIFYAIALHCLQTLNTEQKWYAILRAYFDTDFPKIWAISFFFRSMGNVWSITINAVQLHEIIIVLTCWKRFQNPYSRQNVRRNNHEMPSQSFESFAPLFHIFRCWIMQYHLTVLRMQHNLRPFDVAIKGFLVKMPEQLSERYVRD